MSLHLGRSWWPAHHIEDDCECPKAPCGLVDADTALADCPEHGWKAAKTMREIHRAELCAAKVQARELLRPKVELPSTCRNIAREGGR